MLKKICIAGSTGSIGCNTLEVIKNLNSNGYGIEVKYITANSNIDLLQKQVMEFSPTAVAIKDKSSAQKFKENLSGKKLEVLSGEEGITELCSRNDYDILVSAMVGFSGLMPTIEAIKNSKKIALANKETLVIAGELVKKLAEEYKSVIIPVDSEHSAIFQCLTGEKIENVDKLIITASGGPFRDFSLTEMKHASVKDALNHPNWKMGNKITIDSSTLMNKGLEVIEARWLFNLDVTNINVLIHPQSIIHSMVEFTDGSIKAQLGVPDMKIPIQYAITYPERIKSDFERIDFRNYPALTFEEPNFQKFQCLQIAYDVLKKGGTYPAVMNAANEVAVELFLENKIKLTQIPEIILYCLEFHGSKNIFTLEDVAEADRITREIAARRVNFYL